MSKKKFEVNAEEITQILFRVLRYFVLFAFVILSRWGFRIYGELKFPTTFESWVFLVLAIGIFFFVTYGSFCWKTSYPFGHVATLLLWTYMITGAEDLVRFSLTFLICMIIYSLLYSFGLRFKIKTFWQGKEIK